MGATRSTGERRRRAEEVFHQAINLPRERVDEFLREQCGPDLALKSSVETLLGISEASLDAFLPAPLSGRFDELDEDVATLPQRIGRYEIVGKIGEGGMGIVYEARQEHPQRLVALKVIRPGMASRQTLRRFQQEGELLGLLQHPGIAQIYEAGVVELDWPDDPAGPRLRRPYFAMELVRGDPLTLYAMQRKLGRQERLELVARLCDAVQHAHQHGVIHRDLKPGNILVNAEGQPKVLDFGVARLSSADRNMTTLRTDAGQLIGTIPYMSPEQLGGDPRELDTRCDVYAIGVILYELLSGRLPFDTSGRSIADLARAAAEQKPPPLSATDRSLRGDIETIVAKTLEKDKTRRYASAAELADDVRRCVTGEPIAARRDSLIYVLRKRLQRSRFAVAMTAGFIVLLTVFAVAAAIESREYRRLATSETAARREALSARDEATRERDAAFTARADAEWRSYVANVQAAQAAIGACDADTALRRLAETPPQYRNWEWRYLVAAADISLRTIDAHRGWANSVRYSPDGKCIVTAGSGGAVRLFDAASGGQIRQFAGRGKYVHAAVFSADGARVAAASRDGGARVWETATGRLLVVLKKGRESVSDIAFSPDGSRIATACADGRMRLWSAESGALLLMFGDEGYRTHRLAFSPDGCRIASTGNENTARLWDAESGAPLRSFVGHDSWVDAVAFSPQRGTLATSSLDGTVKLWDVESGQERLTLRGHTGRVTFIQFDALGKRLVSTSYDNTARVWNAQSGALLDTFIGHRLRLTSAAFRPDGQEVVTASIDGTIKFWPAPAVEPLRPAEPEQGSLFLAFSPDTALLARAVITSPDVMLWGVGSHDQSACLTGHNAGVESVAFCPDGERLATGSRDTTVRVWSTSGRELLLLRGHDAAVQSLAFSPDGRDLASGDANGRLMMWRGCSANSARVLQTAGPRIVGLTYSPDGRALAVVCPNEPVRICDPADGQIRDELSGPTGTVTAAAFSHDGSTLAAGAEDGTIRLWDLATARVVHTLSGHARAVRGLAFTADDSRLASGSLDGSVRVWDVARGQDVLTLRTSLPFVRTVAFNAAADRLAAASGDRGVQVFLAPLELNQDFSRDAAAAPAANEEALRATD